MKSKKGSIGITLSWFVAFIIIFFVLLFFVILVLALSTRYSLSTDRNVISREDSEDILEANRMFEFFLKTPVDFKGDNITISELTGVNRVTESDEFREAFLTSYRISFYKYYFRSEDFRSFWVGFYSINKNPSERGLFHIIVRSPLNCFIDKPESVYLFEYYTGNKKIVSCITKVHLKNLRRVADVY